MTDEASYYTKVGGEFAEHGVVHHGRGEYGRGETHTIEGYFSIFKSCGHRSMHRAGGEAGGLLG